MAENQAALKPVVLFHAGKIQHYRLGLYDYLHDFLKKCGYSLIVVSEGCELEQNEFNFPEIRMKFTFRSLVKLTKRMNPGVVILFINHRQWYYFPFLFYLRLKGNRTITWTHGLNLQKKKNVLSRLAHHLEHALCRGIILYAPGLKQYLLPAHRKKAFVACNTLNIFWFEPSGVNRRDVLSRYNITTEKNIIFVGRITQRKRLPDLLRAFEKLKTNGVGLILAGPDEDGLLSSFSGKAKKVFQPGAIYGRETLELLSASDVCCIPGAVGLTIVDAMYCGLPVVTEQVNHGPEIMYLKDGVNGFVVPCGDINALAEKLDLLLTDDNLRKEMGRKAREEILTAASLENFAAGFLQALDFLDS